MSTHHTLVLRQFTVTVACSARDASGVDYQEMLRALEDRFCECCSDPMAITVSLSNTVTVTHPAVIEGMITATIAGVDARRAKEMLAFYTDTEESE